MNIYREIWQEIISPAKVAGLGEIFVLSKFSAVW